MTQAEEHETLVYLIATILDDPNIYMGGPSPGSKRKASKILDAIAEQAKDWPTEKMLRVLPFRLILAREYWRSMFAASPLTPGPEGTK